MRAITHTKLHAGTSNGCRIDVCRSEKICAFCTCMNQTLNSASNQFINVNDYLCKSYLPLWLGLTIDVCMHDLQRERAFVCATECT